MTAPAYTRYFWGKSDREDPQRIHLLEHHMADVGACFEALLSQPTIRQRLARSGGLPSLDDVAIARLAVLAALHDIGKVNVGFQTRIWQPEDLPEGEKLPQGTGHIADLAPVLNGKDRQTAEWFLEALQWSELEQWDDTQGETVCGLFLASLSHHGRPFQLDDPKRDKNPRVWQRLGQLEPQRFVERVGKLIRRWFPQAFGHGTSALPSAPSFQHHFLGLCNLADWVGSNESWFKYVDTPDDIYIDKARTRAEGAINAIGLSLSERRASFNGPPEFSKLFDIPGSPPPNAIQQVVAGTPLIEQLLIVESETGSGKTEAVLWRFARMYEAGLVDGLYFALPTRAAAIEIHERVCGFIANLFPEATQPEPVLAVPGYLRVGGVTGRHLPNFEVLWDDGANEHRWAAESPKQFLAAQVAVGTVDQALLGALKVKNAHLRTACLARNLLVVDEVHASDPYMSVILEALLDTHVSTGGYAVLMSATLGSVARRRWLRHDKRFDHKPPALDEAIRAPYPSISVLSDHGKTLTPAGENDQEKNIAVEALPAMGDFAVTAQRALTAARAGAKVLVARNTVGHAIRTQEALEQLSGPDDLRLLFTVNEVVTLHHSRFAAEDRQLLDQQLKAALGRNRQIGGRIVVGTQTLEQSLDIDADLLITDLCPTDVLLQRIGRLHRHRDNNPIRPTGYRRPTCIVLTPSGHDLEPLLNSGQDANGLGPKGHVYEDLRILEATRRLIDEYSEWRVPEMNRELVERATHPDVLASIAQEKGEDWISHGNQLLGKEFADRGSAHGAYIRRDKSFFTDNQEVLFPADDERIRTRLGEDRIDIVLEPQPTSPFEAGLLIGKVAVSVCWLRLQQGQKVPETVETTASDEGFDFSVGNRKFRYDRRGLRRA